MADLWIGDAYGRVLGPLGLELIQDLVLSGRLHGIARVSADGTTWEDISAFPAIAQIVAANTGEARKERDLAEAARLGVELERLREKAPHEVFGLAADAPIEAWRAGFFALVKQYYPERVDAAISPELARVNTELFVYLSELMAFIERHPPKPSVPAAPADGPVPEAPVAVEPRKGAAPSTSAARRTGPQAVIIPPPPDASAPAPTPRPAAVPASPTPPPVRNSPRRSGANPVIVLPHDGAPATNAPAPVTSAPAASTPPRLTPSPFAAPGSTTPRPFASPAAAAPTPSGAATGAAPNATAPEPPTYALREFIGFERRQDDIVQANVRVTPESCWIFTANRLCNIARTGVFIPCYDVQPLGSRVEMRFRFADPEYEVSARGIVVSWNAGGDPKNPRGFGIEFTRLSKADLAFVRAYIAKVTG